MAEPAGALISDDEVLTELKFQNMASKAPRSSAACSISHDDLKLDTFLRVNRAECRALMVVDLE